MGGGQSTKEVVKYVESDESKRMKLIGKLENQLEELKKEVVGVEPIINKDILKTTDSVQDATLLRYSQLQNKEEIVKDIRAIFGTDFPLLEFLVETAATLVAAMNNTKELTEVLRWHERKVVKRIGNKVVGLEVHYKVRILEEDKMNWMRLQSSKETVVLIAYKCLAHTMNLRPEDFLDEDDRKKLTF